MGAGGHYPKQVCRGKQGLLNTAACNGNEQGLHACLSISRGA